MDPELMVEEVFLQVTDEEIKNYIRHAEYFFLMTFLQQSLFM